MLKPPFTTPAMGQPCRPGTARRPAMGGGGRRGARKGAGRDRLAHRGGRWQRGAMPSSHPHRSSRAAGSLLALSLLAGGIGGIFAGQPSAGLVIGAVVGTAIVLILWAVDRRRSD